MILYDKMKKRAFLSAFIS